MTHHGVDQPGGLAELSNGVLFGLRERSRRVDQQLAVGEPQDRDIPADVSSEELQGISQQPDILVQSLHRKLSAGGRIAVPHKYLTGSGGIPVSNLSILESRTQ